MAMTKWGRKGSYPSGLSPSKTLETLRGTELLLLS